MLLQLPQPLEPGPDRGRLLQYPLTTAILFVGASLLAKNAQAPRFLSISALSLTIFASKLAPTVGRQSP
ncbi:hypothetical protein DK871_23425 [Pseudomonas sp. L13]|nr:hypothetical protein [Pseudomonas sp. L13]